MRPASIGPFSGQQGSAGWQQWVTDAIKQVIDYSQQPFISLTGDVTSLIGGAKIATRLASELNTLAASSSASLSDTNSFTNAYTAYEIILENVVPATNAVKLQLQVHSGGSFKNTTYLNSAGGVTTYIDVTQANISNAAGLGVSGRLTLFNPSATNTNKFVTGTVAYWTGAAIVGVQTAGFWNGGQGAIDGVQFLFTAGNIASGNILIRGVP